MTKCWINFSRLYIFEIQIIDIKNFLLSIGKKEFIIIIIIKFKLKNFLFQIITITNILNLN